MSGVAFFLLGVLLGVAGSFVLLLVIISLEIKPPRPNYKGVRGNDGR